MQKPVTLISGTRKGIGKGLAEYYASKGHIVIGFSRENISWNLENYLHFEGDVNDEVFVVQLLQSIKRKYGRLDHLINNAAIAVMNHSLMTPQKTVNAIFNTNVLGTFLLCREAAKLMKKNNYGRIVNFSTVAVPLRLDGESIYAASKSAVITLTQILAKEFAPFGITLNALGPTPIKTDLIKSVPKHKIEKIISNQAIKRMGELDDIINVINFFLSPESHFITGQQIYLGGVS